VEEFFGRYRNLSVLLAVVLAQIILLGYQVRTDQGSSLLREWTVRGVTPVTKGVRGVTNWIGSSWDSYFWLVGTKQDNDELLRQVEGLKLENAGLRSSLARFGREDRLIAYQQELISQTVLAQVIGRGANSNSREVFISAGLDDGVTAGMPVITPDGIVGKVQAAYPRAALVMLINDPEAGVGVVMSRSRAGGILKGTGHSYCGIDYISHEVDVAMGETVYTSGDDRVFPKGLPIGEVVKLDRGTDFQEIRIKPFAALDRLEEVLVITAGIHQDLPESPQAQPPQFLMPLPEKVDPLRTGETPEQASEGPAPPADPRKLEQSGRVTDADRLRQYYQAITARQGHRIGYGLPGSPPPNFNPEHPPTERTAPGSASSPGSSSARGSSNTPGSNTPGNNNATRPTPVSPPASSPRESTTPAAEPGQPAPQPPASREPVTGQPAQQQPEIKSAPRPVQAAGDAADKNKTAPAAAQRSSPVADPGPPSRAPSSRPAGTVTGGRANAETGSESSAADPAASPSVRP
jgi:rod shape-determining protein MreC